MINGTASDCSDDSETSSALTVSTSYHAMPSVIRRPYSVVESSTSPRRYDDESVLPTPRAPSEQLSHAPMQNLMTQYADYKRKQDEANISRMANIVNRTEERKVLQKKKERGCCLL